jgi:hypothetical protein
LRKCVIHSKRGTIQIQRAISNIRCNCIYDLIRRRVWVYRNQGRINVIAPLELWDAVQGRLLNQAPHERGLEKQTHKNLLTGLIFDEYGNPYTPVFTNKKNKKYRYYCNPVLAKDTLHPDKARSRFPAHEIETMVEKVVRGEVARLSGEEQGAAFEYLLKHQGAVAAYDLIRNCVERITVKFDCLSVKFKSKNFVKLVEKHLCVSVTGCGDGYKITVPFQTKRGRDVAMVVPSQMLLICRLRV